MFDLLKLADYKVKLLLPTSTHFNTTKGFSNETKYTCTTTTVVRFASEQESFTKKNGLPTFKLFLKENKRTDFYKQGTNKIT